jgi:RND family efflux transporter MFP subunit
MTQRRGEDHRIGRRNERETGHSPKPGSGRGWLHGHAAIWGLVGVTLAACSGSHATQKTHESASIPAARVAVMKLGSADSVDREEVIGTVHANVRATVEAKVSGRITTMPVRLGQAVRRGALLVALDAQEIQARYNQSNAAYSQAKVDFERAQALLKSSAATQNEFDATNARYQIAQAALDEARVMLGYVRVRAPFDGVITAKHMDVGDLASPGRPLLEIEQPGRMRLEVGIPETLMGRVHVGTVLPVALDSVEGELQATVSEVAPSADANTRTFLAKLDLPANEHVRAGQYGRAFVPASRGGILRVPTTAIIERGQMQIVFVVHDNKAYLRLIKTGKRWLDQIEVVSGLATGEVVVIDGAQQLQDGQPVMVTP